ncbi:hypothetical protein L3Q82_016104, partial [Scortum barcoo]
MMAPEPLRSAMTLGSAEDTSLALPSDNKLHSGQQRVLDQVHTIKRSKSKPGKNGSPSPSPTTLSPQSFSAFSEFGTFKFSPSKTNGTFSRTNSNMSAGYSKMPFILSFHVNAQKSRTLSSKTTGRRHVSTSGTWENRINTSTWPHTPNGLKLSRSDPALVPPFSPAPVPVNKRSMGFITGEEHSLKSRLNRLSVYSVTDGQTARIVRPPSAQFTTEGKMGSKTSKIEQTSAVNSMVNLSDVTLKEAVSYLSHLEENYQQYGATVIQHATFKEDSAKQEVSQLGGIPTLVALLRSPNAAVNQAAAGALRNLVFKNRDNKLEVQHCGGIAKALQLLKETDSTETQKQITGLLWNLSSADELKGELIATALPALTENVVVPFTCWSDNSANNNIHPDVFYSTTGCLRNLSCAKQKERQAMRECRGLIDSLMTYVQSCVAEENPDDKSVENCACILHNLTYQLESESTECFRQFSSGTGAQFDRKSPTTGCFSPKGNKAQKEFSFDMSKMPMDSTPSGVNWLCHPKAMQTYLSLLGSSKKDATLEACCGALQNLTASKGLGSSAMSQILVQKLGALTYVSPCLKSSNTSLQKTAISLLGNMSRTGSLQTSIAKQILPDLTGLLSSLPRGTSDETISTACSTVRSLMMADTEASKKFVNMDLVSSITDLSKNGSFPKGSQAASLLLYSLWNDKNLQGAVKKVRK